MSLFDSLSRPNINESVKRFVDMEYKSLSDADREYYYYVIGKRWNIQKRFPFLSLISVSVIISGGLSFLLILT